jgi:hypothetical protein
LEAKKKPEGKAEEESRKLKSECSSKSNDRDCCTEQAEKKQGLEKMLTESFE